MKKLLIFAALALLVSVCTAQDSTEPDLTGMAQVQKRQGIEIYVMAEPMREYEVVGEVGVNDADAFFKALSGEGDGRPLEQKIDMIIQNAKRRLKKGKIEEFDAIMTLDGNKGVVIKFTD